MKKCANPELGKPAFETIYDFEEISRSAAVKPKDDKIVRMSTQSAKIEAGHVHLPRKAPWLDEFRKELLAFPQGAHDDQVDSLSQFLNWIDNHQRRKIYMRQLTGL